MHSMTWSFSETCGGGGSRSERNALPPTLRTPYETVQRSGRGKGGCGGVGAKVWRTGSAVCGGGWGLRGILFEVEPKDGTKKTVKKSMSLINMIK